MSSEKIIVLYERLSREDENLGESYSISNQKKLLEDYCREKGGPGSGTSLMMVYPAQPLTDHPLRL